RVPAVGGRARAGGVRGAAVPGRSLARAGHVRAPRDARHVHARAGRRRTAGPPLPDRGAERRAAARRRPARGLPLVGRRGVDVPARPPGVRHGERHRPHLPRRPAAVPGRAAALGRIGEHRVTPRVSTLDHWESYWKGHRQDIEDTYSTGGRLVREVLADGPVAGRFVMEIGAGSGRDLLELARQGARGIVLDYSPASLALVRDQAKRLGIPVMLVQADATRMPFRDGAIDVSFHQGLLEHFRDPRPLLAENARITRPGGRVLVDVPQTFHLYTVMKNSLILVNRWFAGWETQFTVGQLEKLVRESGLEVVRSYG